MKADCSFCGKACVATMLFSRQAVRLNLCSEHRDKALVALGITKPGLVQINDGRVAIQPVGVKR